MSKPHVFLRDGLWWVTLAGRDRNTAAFGYANLMQASLYLQRQIGGANA